MIAVSNTSPLILLAKIRRLDLLCQLYHHIVVPTSVLAEVTAKSTNEAERIKLLVRSGQCQVRQASAQAVKDLPDDLGSGERETIALALETRADLVILDDQRGRRSACEQGLTVTGTVGVLVEAKWRGLIPSLRQDLDRLVEAGMWMNEAFYHRLLLESQE
jgi:hypothetical protein